MSKKDKIKSMIDFYKALILAFLAALFSVLGYIYIHRKTLTSEDIWLLGLSLALIITLLAVFVALFSKELKKIEKED